MVMTALESLREMGRYNSLAKGIRYSRINEHRSETQFFNVSMKENFLSCFGTAKKSAGNPHYSE